MDFLSRHRNKFIALGVVVAVGAGAYYYVKRMVLDGLNQIQDQIVGIQKRVAETKLREAEIARLKGECSVAIVTFIRPLHKQISHLTDPREVTETLKQARENRPKQTEDAEKSTGGEQDSSGAAALDSSNQDSEEIDKLWDELKVMSISRLIASIYALALMDGMLRVQQLVLARNAFEEIAEQREERQKEEKEKSNGESQQQQQQQQQQQAPPAFVPKKITPQMRERYMLRSTEYFITESVPKLVQCVSQGVAKATSKWRISEPVTREEIEEMIIKIRHEIEGVATGEEFTVSSATASNGSESKVTIESMTSIPLNAKSHELFLTFLIQPDNIINNISPDASGSEQQEEDLSQEQITLLKDMMNESMDIMESPHFAIAIEDALNSIFENVLADLRERKFEPRKHSKNTDPSAPEDYVLAKVLVGMKNLVKDILASNSDTTPGNIHVQEIEKLGSFDSLARMIFEIDAKSGTDDFGLGDLGLGEEEMKTISSLLEQTGTGGGGGGLPPNLQQLLGGAMGGLPLRPPAPASANSA